MHKFIYYYYGASHPGHGIEMCQIYCTAEILKLDRTKHTYQWAKTTCEGCLSRMPVRTAKRDSRVTSNPPPSYL